MMPFPWIFSNFCCYFRVITCNLKLFKKTHFDLQDAESVFTRRLDERFDTALRLYGNTCGLLVETRYLIITQSADALRTIKKRIPVIIYAIHRCKNPRQDISSPVRSAKALERFETRHPLRHGPRRQLARRPFPEGTVPPFSVTSPLELFPLVRVIIVLQLVDYNKRNGGDA